MSARRDSLCRLADEELMRRIAGADADAFEILYDRHIDAAYALAYRISGQAGLADDVTQESFLTVWRSAARYDPARGSVRSWTLTVVHNRAIDQLRRLTRHTDRQAADSHDEQLQLAAADDTEAQAMQAVETEEMHDLLGGLPDEQRDVVELSFYSGYSHTEIADMLHVPLGTVKGRMRRALGKLGRAMEGTSR